MRTGRVLVAVALAACGQSEHPPPGNVGDRPYPRLASYRPSLPLDDAERAIVARIPLAIIDAEAGALDLDTLTNTRARNRTVQLVASLSSASVPVDASVATHPLADARADKVPSEAWVVTAGSTTVSATSTTDT